MDNLALDLLDFDQTPVEQDGFKIEDTNGLNWAFRKLAKVRAQKAQNDSAAQAEKERINAWLETSNENLERSEGYFAQLITDYYSRILEQDPKAKINSPYGKVSRRTITKWNYGDEDALTAFLLESAPEYVAEKVERKPNKKALKSDCTVLEDGRVALEGEIIEGVTVAPETTVKVETIGG